MNAASPDHASKVSGVVVIVMHIGSRSDAGQGGRMQGSALGVNARGGSPATTTHLAEDPMQDQPSVPYRVAEH